MPRTDRATDVNLVRRSQRGDRRAFRALLARYDRRLRGLAHTLLLDAGRVDAVLRMAYIRAWREVVRIRPKEEPAAWLYRMVYNACVDALRRESARSGAAPPSDVSTAEAMIAESPGPPPAPRPPSGSPPADDGAESPRPGQGQVEEALAALAPADRVAVVLVDRERFSPSVAARILGLRRDVLETRLAGARAHLVDRLSQERASTAEPATEDIPADEVPADGAAGSGDTEPSAATGDTEPSAATGDTEPSAATGDTEPSAATGDPEGGPDETGEPADHADAAQEADADRGETRVGAPVTGASRPTTNGSEPEDAEGTEP